MSYLNISEKLSELSELFTSFYSSLSNREDAESLRRLILTKTEELLSLTEDPDFSERVLEISSFDGKNEEKISRLLKISSEVLEKPPGN